MADTFAKRNCQDNAIYASKHKYAYQDRPNPNFDSLLHLQMTPGKDFDTPIFSRQSQGKGEDREDDRDGLGGR